MGRRSATQAARMAPLKPRAPKPTVSLPAAIDEEGQLSVYAKRAFAIERLQPEKYGLREARIRREFEDVGLEPDRYYQFLNQLIKDPRVEALAPTDVRRVRRVQASQRTRRGSSHAAT